MKNGLGSFLRLCSCKITNLYPFLTTAVASQSQSLLSMHIVRQDSLEQDKIYRNGAQKTVHAVIKNLPFEVELRAAPSVNFNTHTVTAALLYDGDEARQVHFVKSAPIEYNCQVAQGGKAVVVEVKLSVLSSQHEDMFFRIRFSAADTTHAILSEAIKVVSKPAQLKKNRGAKARGQKRPLNASVQESLLRIEAQQRDQQALLSTLTSALSSLSSSSPSSASLAAVEQRTSKKQRLPDEPEATDSPTTTTTTMTTMTTTTGKAARERFEEHLAGLVGAYSALHHDLRPLIVRRAVRSAPVHQTETISELIDCLWAEGLHKEVGRNVDTGSPYAVAEPCGQWSPASPSSSSSCSSFSLSSSSAPAVETDSDFDPSNFYDELFGSAPCLPPPLREGEYHPQF